MTVTNALSSYFKLATYRNDYVHIIEFEEGKKINDVNRPLKKGEKKHGTITEFTVNEKYMGKNSSLPIDTVVDWIDMMTYQISAKIKITVDIYDGINRVETKKFKARPFGKIIEKFVPDIKKVFYDPIVLSGDSSIVETITDSTIDSKTDKVNVKDKKVKKDIHLEVVFTHDDIPENDYVSFCNFTKTDEGGVHLDSVEEVVCRFFQQKTKSFMTDKEKEKWDITWADIKYGLKMVVNLSTSAQVQFMGNAKNKIQNAELKPILKEIINTELTKYYEKNESKIQSICKLIKLNARARVESQKVRTATKIQKLDRFDELSIPNYVSCNNRGKKYKELFLVEGERSATGSVRNGRNHDTQAIFGFRGVTKNPYKCSVSEVLSNNEWKNFIKVLRTGFGKDFDINKLYYDKIILLTDADIDGFYISSGICAFIALLIPEIITEGHLYKVYPPLYQIKDGKKFKFLNSKSDLTEEFMKKVTKKYKIYLQGDKNPLSKDELFEFLYDTLEYYNDLKDLGKYFSVDKYFIERVANFLLINDIHKATNVDKYLESNKFVTSFMSYLQKEYPEVNLEKKNRLRGVVEGQIASIKINDRNLKKFSDFENIFKDYGYEIVIENKDTKEKRTITIGRFMEETYPLRPDIYSRFKGLGETDAEDMGKTTLDPENRILVQLTMDDAKEALKIFNKLNGNKKKDSELRKEMMRQYKIDKENLDN